jgi:UTP--glucose-1-phosphate uridylyltransferase
VRGQRHRGDHPRHGARQGALEDHFDRNGELEALLEKRGKTADLALARRPTELARVVSVRQARRVASGTPCCVAREAVGDEPFAVVLGDDLLDANPPGVRQLLDVYERWGTGVVGLKEVPAGQEHLYGIVEGESVGKRQWKLSRLVEKPAPGTAPRGWPSSAATCCPPRSSHPRRDAARRGGEIQLTDGLATLCARRGLHGVEMEGQRYDAGDRAGYVLAQLHWALKRKEIAAEVRAGAKRISKRLRNRIESVTEESACSRWR